MADDAASEGQERAAALDGEVTRSEGPANDKRLRYRAGGPTTGGLISLAMVALVTAVGTPAFQLPAVNQSLDVAPVQLVWARVATVDAESTAITAVVVSKCVRIDAPRLTNPHFEQTFCHLKIGVKDVSAWPRRFLGSCGFSAALSNALFMTHNQLSTLVGIDAKVICNVSIGDEERELIDTIVRGEKPVASLVMGVNQIAAQAINISSSPAPAGDRIAASIAASDDGS